MKFSRGRKTDYILSAIAFLVIVLAAVYFLFRGRDEDTIPKETQTNPPELTQMQDTVEEKAYSMVEQMDYEILYCIDPSLPKGEEEILRPGVQGQRKQIGQAVYVNGQIESVTVSETVVLAQPVSQIVAVGSGESEGASRKYPLVGEGILYTAGGELLHYCRVEKFQATAYTSWVGGVTGTTACGTQARVGAVAVDPSVIPYFTSMYIVSDDGIYDYGKSSAEDCGGAIKGNIVDLYFNSLQACYQFGRRDVWVYFLTEEEA